MIDFTKKISQVTHKRSHTYTLHRENRLYIFKIVSQKVTDVFGNYTVMQIIDLTRCHFCKYIDKHDIVNKDKTVH